MKLGFYEGYVTGGGTPTTATAVFTLAGLPGSTGSCSFFGGFKCFFLSVTFAPLVCFADGPIGYSWKFLDYSRCGLFPSGTFPFLSCVQSCSGPGPDRLGLVDVIDEYCPPGVLRSTFSFGTTIYGGYFTSMSMDIREAADVVATAAPFVGDGVNEDTLAAFPAILGASWTATITSVNSHGAGGPISVKVRSSTVNGPNFPSPFGGRINEVLIGGSFRSTLTGAHNGVSGTVGAMIPKQLALLCVPWAAQGTIVGGGFADLTTAVAGVTGTQ